ncbi:DNA polymerase lambda (POLL [Striga hermonthica]|uniref:DNA polymerase n=1 Tax=Striga hermonthica TaxID=68872 RepID=A0A9N7NHK1_STRHE|nr:DNA polymerase lambda (POLL [Striga hermonthica]
MAPKARKKSPPSDPDGMFSGMVVFLIETAIQARRLQIWKQKLVQMGAQIEEAFSKRVNHIFAADSNSLWQKMEGKSLKGFKGKVLNYQWLEDSLRIGEKASEDLYIISSDTRGINKSEVTEEKNHPGHINPNHLSTEDPHPQKKIKPSPEASKTGLEREDNGSVNASGSSRSPSSLGPDVTSPSSDGLNTADSSSEASLLYSPPDLNRNITEIFGKLINIYRALGDDRRSFSYYKAIPVIEKLPFKIESADQVKDLPGIGKSLQDHIQEIVNTGKLSKLEHFEKDEKVRTINLFGEVWGIGPATAVKLYEKGYRTLDDLKNEESLTNSQKLGLKYFDDIRTRIPRHEVQEMESLIQKVGEEILPGVVIVCGGSYRRGKASCGDMDIVITHPDATSPMNGETEAAAMMMLRHWNLAACVAHKGGGENPNFHVDGAWDVALCVLPLFRLFSLAMALVSLRVGAAMVVVAADGMD